MKNDADTPTNLTGTKVILRVPVRPKVSHNTSAKPARLHARAVKRILDRKSGTLVGWLYEWNTGELVPRWKGVARADVIYV
ncbi:MAG: hypothetical protein AAFU69_12905 [Pseudomonadota bacterium]